MRLDPKGAVPHAEFFSSDQNLVYIGLVLLLFFKKLDKFSISQNLKKLGKMKKKVGGAAGGGWGDARVLTKDIGTT